MGEIVLGLFVALIAIVFLYPWFSIIGIEKECEQIAKELELLREELGNVRDEIRKGRKSE